MPALLAGIGTVKAGSLRVARRMANTLRAGHAVEDYAELGGCGLIWIAVPEASLDAVRRELQDRINISNKMIAICDSARDAGALRIGAARVATLNAVQPEERVLVVEGHSETVREIRRVSLRDGRKVVELAPRSKALFLAGLHLAEYLALPCFAAAVESLRAAGFSRAEATSLVE